MAKFSDSMGSISDLKIEEAGTWPLLPKLFLYLVAMAFGAFIIYWTMVKPNLESIETIERQTQEIEQTIESRKLALRRFEGQEELVIELTQELIEANKVLPLQQEQPELIDTVAERALATNLNLTDFRPGSEVAREQFYELPINLTFVGGYHAFGDFMAKVSSMERLVIPTELQLKTRGEDLEPGMLSGNLILKTFRFKEPVETPTVTVTDETSS